MEKRSRFKAVVVKLWYFGLKFSYCQNLVLAHVCLKLWLLGYWGLFYRGLTCNTAYVNIFQKMENESKNNS